jgi:hypothetical protein
MRTLRAPRKQKRLLVLLEASLSRHDWATAAGTFALLSTRTSGSERRGIANIGRGILQITGTSQQLHMFQDRVLSESLSRTGKPLIKHAQVRLLRSIDVTLIGAASGIRFEQVIWPHSLWTASRSD